ncbi:hypothetical protein [Ferruginibacter albus]|uniref:hypothetical protein n=1 Tax=Ferruginibacter albus TaxID=2875540 RepID=UPI001CC79355|nr:hypothetical protein [Ferruginibacter albus]UAY50645.1 hypothetical protein K9M53_08565 [Ferruginibacter albus]
MIKKELENKLESFLKENKRSYNQGSIRYIGLSNRKMLEDEDRMLHIVAFSVLISEELVYDDSTFYFAGFDEKDHHLVQIIGPQSYERFEK